MASGLLTSAATGAPAPAGAARGPLAARARGWAAPAGPTAGLTRPLAFAAALLAVVMVLAVGWIVADASVGASALLPYSPYLTRWLRGLTGERLGYQVFLGCLLAFTAAYAGLLPLARRLPVRAIVGLLAVLYLLVFIGPILLSTDVFSYLAYARMGVVHGLNPYVALPVQIHHDPIYPYVGSDWIYTPSAYGPLYTLFSYPFALLGVVGGIWGMKAVALIACVCVDWLAWRCARVRGLDQKLALMLVGANPLVLIYSLASAHNDFIMIALMMAAVYLTITAPVAAEGENASEPSGDSGEPGTGTDGAGTGDRGAGRGEPAAAAGEAGAAAGMVGAEPQDARGLVGSGVFIPREAAAAAALVAGTLVKATVAAVLPFMILGRRRLSAVAGAAVSLAVGLGVAYAVFGIHGVDIVSALNRDSAYVSTDSFATEIAHLLGKPGVFPVDHEILKGMLAAIGLYLLWRTWRGYDWVAASGWALLAITVTTTWLLAWYLIWPLPIAAVSRDRRLLWATLAVQALFIIHQLSPFFTPQV